MSLQGSDGKAFTFPWNRHDDVGSLTMIAAALLFVGGLVLLYFGAEWLVRGASSISVRLGLSPIVAGAVIVAYGTSMPELVVSVQAALKGDGPLAVANIVGSNICTIGLVLGLAALVFPLKVNLTLIRWHVPVMIAAVVLLSVFLFDGTLSRMEGAILFGGGVVFTVANLLLARKEEGSELIQEFEQSVGKTSRSVARDIALLTSGAVALFLGGNSLVDGASDLAARLNVSSAMIGLTVVALGTSSPDLMATLVAAWRKEPDIAVGNAIGSILFNVLSAAGLAALLSPLATAGIHLVDHVFMIGMACLALPLMRSGYVVKRWEGGVFVLLYCVYLTLCGLQIGR